MGAITKRESMINFLKSLEQESTTMSIMLDRIDTEEISIMLEYSDMIHRIKNKSSLSDSDVIRTAMIIGYLLKSHVDRFELTNQILKNE